VLLLLPL
jgi:hypothetical protein